VLALVGRLNQQLQVITLAFPVKMMLAIAVLVWTLALYTIVYGEQVRRTAESMLRLVR
jgi:flagellar biosynthesis protein FliR